MKARLDVWTVSAILVTLLFWSSAFAGIRFALGSFQPGEVALLRFVVASLAFTPAVLARRIRIPIKRDWPGIFVLGLTGISAYQLALGYAETRVSPGTAAIVIALVPGVTAALAAFRLKERLARSAWVGLGIAFVGALLTIAGSGRGLHFEPAALLLLICVVTTSVYFVWQKPLLARMRSLDFTAASLFGGMVGLLPFGLHLPEHLAAARPAHVLAVVYLGICPSALGYVLWNWALSRAPAGSVSSFLFLQPLLAAVIAGLWLGVGVSPLAMVGGVLAVGGVIVVQRSEAIVALLRRAFRRLMGLAPRAI
jgi:drug/metabolite transporter (DMT)-like permease